jgi:uncharacterized membrane protein YqgA involved in biofilm formation
MQGAVINGVLILAGAGLGLMLAGHVRPSHIQWLRVLLMAGALGLGLTGVVHSLDGSWIQVLQQLGVAGLGLVIGNAVGTWIRLQDRFESWLRRVLADSDGMKATPGGEAPGIAPGPSVSLTAQVLWFAASPLTLLAWSRSAYADDWRVFALKGCVDATAAFTWVRASPLRMATSALCATLLLTAGAELLRELRPWLESRDLLPAIGLITSLLVLNSSMLLLGGVKVRLINQMPSLIVTPVLWTLLLG